ncbi:hypothetical protein HDV06_000146 [Boothiomyces sp. JEL0866]|nr:hypothetical protein HDV06_000146 [Boothiomyces sp. JEL0866]
MKKKYIERHLEIAVSSDILSRKLSQAKRKPLNVDQFLHILQLENRNILGIYQRILALVNINQRNLLELALFSIKYDDILTIHDKLAGFISLYPYNEDAELLGYAGIISLLVYQRKRQTRFITQAVQLLKSSIILSPNNMFIDVLQDIMEEEEFIEYLLKLPKDDVVVLKLGEIQKDFSAIVEIDPICDLKIFISHVMQLEKKQMIERLADRLEYENHSLCWKLMITNMINEKYYGSEECREIFEFRDWWTEYFTGMYYYIVFDLLGKDPQINLVESDVDDLEIWELYKNEIY